MAKAVENKKVVKKVINQKHKILVAEGAVFATPVVPYKVLHTEFKPNIAETKARVKELQEEYAGKSVTYFSV